MPSSPAPTSPNSKRPPATLLNKPWVSLESEQVKGGSPGRWRMTSNSSDYLQWGLGESSAEYPFPCPPCGRQSEGFSQPVPCPAPISPCLLHRFVIVSIPDAVTPKMFEELKNQLDNLAQEVALLKEQQALQTGDRRCAGRVRGGEGSGDQEGSGKGSQARAWKSPARTGAPAVRIQGAPSSTCSSGARSPDTCAYGNALEGQKASPLPPNGSVAPGALCGAGTATFLMSPQRTLHSAHPPQPSGAP